MNKQTIKVAVISVISTLAVVALVAYIALPKIIDTAKATAVSNFDDEYEEAAYILSQSKEPVLQPNYIITGLIMSPDFQEYLDEGVQNGWWTEDFLAEFLVDESLPIFFTNYHQLFSAILNSEPVQDAANKITFIKSKVQDIISSVKMGLSRLSALLNSPTVTNIKGLIANLKDNKAEIVGLINKINNIRDALAGLDTGKIEDSINKLKNIITTIKGIDTNKLSADIKSLQQLIIKIQNIDLAQFNKWMDSLTKLVTAIQNVDITQLTNVMNSIKNIIDTIQNIDPETLEGQIIANILNSDVVQSMLSNVQATIIKIIEMLPSEFIDYDADYNFYDPITFDGNTYDLSKYAPILNVLDVEVPDDGYVYDNNGTPLKLGDDTLVISKVYVGFEKGTKPSIEILSSPLPTINGSDAILVKNFIPIFNNQV